MWVIDRLLKIWIKMCINSYTWRWLAEQSIKRLPKLVSKPHTNFFSPRTSSRFLVATDFSSPTLSPASYCASLRNTVVSSRLVAQIWMHAAEPLILQTQQLFILGSSPPPHSRPLALATAALKMVKISTCTTAFLLGPQRLHWEYPLLQFTLRAYCKQV